MLDYLPDIKRRRAEEGLAEAEEMATGNCPEAFAREIIARLTAYVDAGETLTLEQQLWLARAYVADGEYGKASKTYVDAGNWYYLNENYTMAHSCYQEAREKTGMTEGANLFRIGYACSKAEDPLTDEQHRYCIDCYQQYLEVEPGSDAARVNLGYHYNCLSEFDASIRWLLPAAQRGKNTIAFGNLANAYYNSKRWEEAISWYEKAAENGRKRASYRIACAKEQIGEYAAAKCEFEALLEGSTDKGDIYAHLLSIAESSGAGAEEIAGYRLGILQHGAHHAHGNEAQWLEQAEKMGLNGVAEEMLIHLPEIREEREKEARRKADEELLILLM